MVVNSDNYQSRADQVADGFRAVILLVVSALIGYNLNKSASDDPISAEVALLAQISGLVVLFLLGVSWTLQKSKALARARLAKKGEEEQKLHLWLENWTYDLAAFASLLFAVSLLVLGAYECALGIAAIAAALFAVLFIAVAAILRCCVEKWEKRHNSRDPIKQEK
ncbi:MAG: hypothetical protein RIC52_10815 [Amphiplicatus sp.]